MAKRTSFSLFKIEKRDIVIILGVLISDICVMWGYFGGILEFEYFPMISEVKFNVPLILVYVILCIMPLILDMAEERKWRYTELKI